MPAPAAQRHPPARADGFTLVEILLAFALVALMSALLLPLLLTSPGRTLQQTAGEISLQLRELRRASRFEHAHHFFLADTLSRRYRTDTSPWQELPAGMTLELTTAESLLRAEGTGSIDFYPAGGSSGGRIVLGLEGQLARIDVEWLTGRVRQSVASR